MRIFGQEDFDHLLQMLPPTVENNPTFQVLQQMQDEAKVIRQPYTFEVDFSTGAAAAGLTGQFAAPAAAGGIVQGFFLVDSSSPFQWVSNTYEADLAAAAIAVATDLVPHCTVFIQDQSSNRNFMNVAVPIPSIYGRGTNPYFWPQARLVPANTNVQLTLTNFEAANANNIRLAHHGWRYYSVGQ